MTKKLYVDRFSSDKSMAMASDHLSVAYNFKVLNQLIEPNLPCFAAGKYVCVLMASPDNATTMFFFDFKANPANLSDFLHTNEMEESFKIKFLALVEIVNADYAKNLNAVELELGKYPPPVL